MTPAQAQSGNIALKIMPFGPFPFMNRKLGKFIATPDMDGIQKLKMISFKPIVTTVIFTDLFWNNCRPTDCNK